jgi:drug/metabolite transporter (DMT)-like permease
MVEERRGSPPVWAVYGALVGQTAISAGTYLAAKRAMDELGPMDLVLARFALSGGIFILLLAVLPGRTLPPLAALPRVLLLGLLAGPINQGFFFWGLHRSVPAHAALLYALTPLGVYLYLLARGRERASRRRMSGIVVAFCGVVVLLLGRGLAAARGPLVGDLAILVGVAAWVLYTAEGKGLVERYGPFRASAWSMTAAALLTVPAMPFYFHPATVLQASPTALSMILYLAVLTSVVAYLLWYYALSHLEASRVAVFANLQPAATAVAAWLLLGDALTWEIGVGGVLVLWGVRMAQRK